MSLCTDLNVRLKNWVGGKYGILIDLRRHIDAHHCGSFFAGQKIDVEDEERKEKGNKPDVFVVWFVRRLCVCVVDLVLSILRSSDSCLRRRWPVSRRRRPYRRRETTTKKMIIWTLRSCRARAVLVPSPSGHHLCHLYNSRFFPSILIPPRGTSQELNGHSVGMCRYGPPSHYVDVAPVFNDE